MGIEASPLGLVQHWFSIGGLWSSRIDQSPLLKPSSFVADSSVDKSDEALAAQFAAVDTNDSGQIDREELTAAIQKIYGKNTDMVIIDEMLAAGDTDGDGEVRLPCLDAPPPVPRRLLRPLSSLSFSIACSTTDASHDASLPYI